VHASPAFVQFDVGDPARSGKKECFRAIQEAAAYVSRGHVEIITELTGADVGEVVFTGGAAQGRMWPQILADVLGLPVRIPVVKESTALGAAFCAGLGAGVYTDPGDIDQLVRFERTVEPDAAATSVYGPLYRTWLGAYGRFLELSEDGVVRPLWRAAGT
jgi:autoinducer 2 (AI-2) kinase